MKRIVLGIFALALIAMISSPASAGIFFADTFTYNGVDGQLTDAENGAGDNVSGGLWQTHSGASSGKIQVVNGSAVSANGGDTGEDANRNTNRVVGMEGVGTTWYYAGLVTVNDTRADSAGTALESQSYILHFKDSGTFNFVARAHVTDPSTGVGGAGYRYGLRAGSGTADVFTQDLNFGQEYKVMASFDAVTGTANMWIDPTDINSPSITHTDGGRVGTLIEALAIRQDSSNPERFDALINAVSIGDDFNSVMRYLGTDVPEPTSLALGLLGLVGFASTRRRS